MAQAKLSKLQKAILQLAYEKRLELGREHFDISFSEILRDHFGWDSRNNNQETADLGSHEFKREEIGHDKYNRGRATLSRTLKRLRERELIEFPVLPGGRHSIKLTHDGLEIARQLATPDTDYGLSGVPRTQLTDRLTRAARLKALMDDGTKELGQIAGGRRIKIDESLPKLKP